MNALAGAVRPNEFVIEFGIDAGDSRRGRWHADGLERIVGDAVRSAGHGAVVDTEPILEAGRLDVLAQHDLNEKDTLADLILDLEQAVGRVAIDLEVETRRCEVENAGDGEELGGDGHGRRLGLELRYFRHEIERLLTRRKSESFCEEFEENCGMGNENETELAEFLYR